MCSKGKSNARSYGVNVNVLEGRDLVTNAEHVVVRVMIDSQKRYTHSRSHGYSPHFDEYFLFEFNCTLDELLNKTIRFTVMEPKKRFRSRKTIGEVLLDVALIWDQPISDHFFYHKWTMVTKTQGGNSFLKGYLKIDLSVSTKGTIPQIPKDQSETDEIEGNLLLYNPLSGDYQKALYSFNIYSIQDLDRTSPKHCCQRKDIFIEVYFIGSKLKTSTRSLSNVVEWNEQINFFGLFPPLCQRIRFEIYESCFQKCMATFFLNLRDISNDGENGFLPTFGPSFVYLYNKINEYLGRFLLSVETKTTFQDYGPHEACYTKLISPIETDNFWVNEEIFALCIIVDVSCIDSHFSSDSVGFEISLGRKREQEETSKTLLPVTANKRNHFVLLDRTKPCIYTIATLPNLQMRMFHKNFLEKIYENFSINLDEVETLIYNDENISILQNKFSKTLNEFEVKVKDYLKSEISCNATDLDIYKSRLCIETMKSLLGKSIGIHREKFSRKNFRRTKMMQEKIKLLISQIQECWPDCIISMYHSSKKVAHFRIPCNEICYCDTPVGKGKYCTVKRTIFMQYISTARETIEIPYKFAAKLEIISWLGSYSQRHKCLEELKNLFQQMNKKNENVQFPQALESREINVFQFRAHIYEGRFIPGADKSGLSDPFLRIIIKSLIKKTKTVGGTLNPEWKQTLIINNVVLWGTSKYLSRYPPLVLIEAYDNDKCGNELQGRALVEGSLKFKNEIYKPSKLKWIKITNRGHITGEIFASFELLQVNPDDNTESLTETRIEIPRELLPKLVNQRVEIIFWGVRQLQRTFGCILTKPKITINISNMNLHSTPITNPRQCLNFSNPYVVTDMELPVEKDYAPTLCIQLQDCKSFGRNTYVGVATSNIKNFYYNPRSQSRYNLLKEKPTNFTRLKRYESEHKSLVSENKSMQFGTFKTWCQILHFCGYKRKKVKNSEPYEPLIPNEKKEDEIIDLDWWSKYYASIDGENSEMISGNKDIIPIKIYNSELEAQKEFEYFNDYLASFKLYRGKRTEDEIIEEENLVGIFKGQIKIYKVPPENTHLVNETGQNLALNGVLKNYKPNDPQKCIVRIYVVRGVNLKPVNFNGKSDPYVVIRIGSRVFKDKRGMVKNQLNPTFGRFFEFNISFPRDFLLTVQIWDWNLTQKDIFIGETSIDLENRLYTKHRGHCGLSLEYSQSGYNSWRDPETPSTILHSLCTEYNLPKPILSSSSITIGPKSFSPKIPKNLSPYDAREFLCLYALHNWKEIPLVGAHLVPEHVETRSLFNPENPGIEKGKVQLWVDIFPQTNTPIPPPVDIKPRKPIKYELRVIVWNTEDVLLMDDNYFVGEKMSDIYVRGWITDPVESQSTDIHYHSISGEGNFNWRFVFQFDYIRTENKILITQDDYFFNLTNEIKIPCKLYLQVWDNDTFTSDDFIGCISLELSHLPRGAPNPKSCKLSQLDESHPRLNLFKISRTRGWWPVQMINEQNGSTKLTGKLELEFHLLTKENALRDPVGCGRDDPQGLPPPNRPDISVSWFKNPLKGLRYLIRSNRTRCLCCFLIVLVFIFIFLAIYAIPGYTVEKLIDQVHFVKHGNKEKHNKDIKKED